MGVGIVTGVTEIGLLVEAIALALITSPLSFIFGVILYRDLLSREATSDQTW